MKFYLFILLLALIFCNNIEKKEKINLLGPEDDLIDLINSLVANIINIKDNCSFEINCIVSQTIELICNLPDEDFLLLYDNLLNKVNCKDSCSLVLSSVGDSSLVNEICFYLC